MIRNRSSKKKGKSIRASAGVMSRMYGKSSRAKPTSAIRRYKIFHKKNPRGIVKLNGLPPFVSKLGQCLSVMYETDKWEADGQDTRYKHLHDRRRGREVYAYEAVYTGAAGAQDLPVDPPTPAEGFARLGKCCGFFVKTDSGKVREYNPEDTDLFTSHKGDLLGVYDPNWMNGKGEVQGRWVAFIAGGKLRVEAAGIDG